MGRADTPKGPDRPAPAGTVDLHDPAFRRACGRAARLAAALVAAPCALVSIARDDGEVVAASIGMPEAFGVLRRLPDDAAGIGRGATRASPLAVERTDGGFAAHGLAAYLGVPLAPANGRPLGTLAVADRVTRHWSDDERTRLCDLAALLAVEIERHAIERQARERTNALVRTTEALLAEIEHREQAEATLRQSEARWRILIEHAPEAIVVFDVELGRFVAVNENAERLFGVPRAQLLGLGLADVSAPGQAVGGPVDSGLPALMDRALGGEAPVFDWLIRAGDGHDVPCEIRLVRLPGQRPSIRGSITDISARKHAEQALRASEAALAEAQRIARMGSWELDLDTRAARFSSGLRHLLGIAPNDGRDVFRARIHPDDRAAVEAVLRRSIETGAAYAIDHRIVTAEGAVLSVQHQGAFMREGDGRAVRLVASVVDVSDRIRTETERAELLAREQAARRDAEAARERLTLLVEASARFAASLEVETTLRAAADLAVPQRACWSVVWHVDGEGAVRRVEAGEAPADEELRRAADALVTTVLRSGVARLRADARGALLLVPLRARDRTIGALAWLAPPGSPPYLGDDLALAEELARRAALALDTARLYEEAQSANQLKDEFLATLSHELRTPLAAVLGWASLIRSEDLPPEEVDEALEAIERNARAQTRLVEDVLEVSRIVTGKIRISRRPVEVAPTIRAAVDTLRPSAQEKDLALDVDLPEEPVLVLGDPDRLEQVWSNLLSNAIKFTPHGGRVSVTAAAADAAVVVAVRDTGEGIDPSMLAHVFERFRQGDSSSTRRHGGLGLGLALVRHFVELQGGTVEARSEGRGRGAELRVRLPLLSASTVLPLLPVRSRPSEGGRRPLTGLHVLVVDDETDMRAMMRAVLARRGATVSEAASVSEAMAAVEREPPDVVLSDLQMPGEDGFALLRWLHERERAGATPIPVAAVTAHAGAEHRAQALAAGFHEQVAKPVDAETLARLVLSLAHGERAAAG